MHKLLKRMATLCMVVTMLVSSFAVEAATINLGTQVVYLNSTNSKNAAISYSNSFNQEGIKIKKGGLKSSNKKVAEVVTAYNETSSHLYSWSKKWENNLNGIHFETRVKKPGKATITIKTNKGNLTKTFDVKKYVNPLASLSVAGGKNVASSFKKNGTVLAKKVKKNKKNTKITASTAPGWVIESIQVWDYTEGGGLYQHGYPGVKSAVLEDVDLKKGHEYYVSIRCENVKDNGSNTVYYEMIK